MRVLPPSRYDCGAFTLIELLVVIAIIAVLMGLAFPAFQSVQNSAKRTQAKNDLTQMVTATNAFYTEYGRYPVLSTAQSGTYDDKNNDQLFNVLTGRADQGEQLALNPRRIQFINMPTAKAATKPTSGQAQSGAYQWKWVDPWGMPYFVRVDADYNNNVSNPYSSNAGFKDINVGCIAWSLGKDSKGGSGDKNTGDSKDDVISWQ
jgi:prepilin-type N-terminal cleavage/methylation domain-containing protein